MYSAAIVMYDRISKLLPAVSSLNCQTNLDFTEARDSEQTDNHASTTLLSFWQAGCPSCRPTNSVKALKAKYIKHISVIEKLTQFLFFYEIQPEWQLLSQD